MTMNYIYDILLNFKERYYDFYEWNNSDTISHIRKIPMYKIDQKDLFNIKNNNIKLDISFLDKIENKTEMFTNKGVINIKYACLLTDGNSIIGINYKDKKLKISSLLIDEELDALEDTYNMDIDKIDYIVEKINNYELKTRKCIEQEKFLKKELNKIKDKDKLEYLYYECFDKKETNIDIIMKYLSNLNDEKIIDKLYNFFKLTSVNK